MKCFQSYNNRINAWVKYKKYANGKTIITNVKQRNKNKPFAGIKKK